MEFFEWFVLYAMLVLIFVCNKYIYEETELQKDYDRTQIELLEDIKEELQELNNETVAKNQDNETNKKI